MAGFNPVPLFRYLAARRPLHLGIGYAVAITVALVFQAITRDYDGPALFAWLAWIIGLAALSLLFSVFAWYRDDDLLETAVLLLAITGIGTVAAQSLSSIILHGSIGEAVFLLVPAFLGIVVRLLVLSPVVMLMLWLARKGRRWFAPDSAAA